MLQRGECGSVRPLGFVDRNDERCLVGHGRHIGEQRIRHFRLVERCGWFGAVRELWHDSGERFERPRVDAGHARCIT